MIVVAGGSDTARDVALQVNGRIVVAGEAVDRGRRRFAVTRCSARDLRMTTATPSPRLTPPRAMWHNPWRCLNQHSTTYRARRAFVDAIRVRARRGTSRRTGVLSFRGRGNAARGSSRWARRSRNGIARGRRAREWWDRAEGGAASSAASPPRDVIRLRGFVPSRADDRPTGRRAAVGTGDRDRVRERSGGDDGRPGRRDGQGGLAGDLPERVASPPTPTSPGRRTPTSRCTQRTRFRRSCVASTTRCAGPTRSRGAGGAETRSMVPILADAEAGFGGALNAFELMRAMIEAARRRRALRGPAREREEVRAPRGQGAGTDGSVHPHAHRRPAGRRRGRRADVGGRPPRALGATLLTSDIDPRDRRFVKGERTPEGSTR